jgi:hypothetical protein
MSDNAVDPTRQHSMQCPKLHGEDCTCDGYHTFDELYEHRIRLFIALCRYFIQGKRHDDYRTVWASTLHSDGTSFGDWFILGLGDTKGDQITYHLPARFWEEVTQFAEVLERAPEYDGHTSGDVLERLKALDVPAS